jgi:hypothetical protein
VQGQIDETTRALDALQDDGPTEDEVRQRPPEARTAVDELFPTEKTRIVKLLVQELVVSPDELLICLRLHAAFPRQ